MTLLSGDTRWGWDVPDNADYCHSNVDIERFNSVY